MRVKTGNLRLATSLLDVEDVPLTVSEMANNLNVTFYPPHERSDLLDDFSDRLRCTLSDLGAEVIPYKEAVISGSDGEIEPGVVVIEQGEGKDDDLAMLHLTSLHENPLVSLQEGPCPVPRDKKRSSQARLDTIMNQLTWHLTHIPVFVNQNSWLPCFATGSLAEFENTDDFEKNVLDCLVPKFSAQVVPPTQFGITLREDALSIEEEGYQDFINDFQSSGDVWEESGLMLAHTALDDLSYRDRLHRRLAHRYVNERSGMSYGFVARQLPAPIEPAIKKQDTTVFAGHAWDSHPVKVVDDELYARVSVGGEEWIVKVPDVWVLSTRSGCEKTNINAQRDIVRIGLSRGQILFDLPTGVEASSVQPSYDTLAILAHAIGNAIVASILAARKRDAPFPSQLKRTGASISHWHGYPSKGNEPEGYVTHGRDNPPVSCSTPQSAVYALTGKLSALGESLKHEKPYRGDVHIEPYHGTNVTGSLSLTESAEWASELSK